MEYHKGNVDPTNDGHPLLEVDTAAALGHLRHDERADLQILLELEIKVFNLSNKWSSIGVAFVIFILQPSVCI